MRHIDTRGTFVCMVKPDIDNIILVWDLTSYLLPDLEAWDLSMSRSF